MSLLPAASLIVTVGPELLGGLVGGGVCVGVFAVIWALRAARSRSDRRRDAPPGP